jgi:flagellar L-ring protein precursor FlgH
MMSVLGYSHWALGQTSSLGARLRLTESPVADPSFVEAPTAKASPAYEAHSWISVRAPRPRLYRVHDLLTIVVRQQRSFEIEADLKTQKKWDIKSQLDDFFKLTDGGLGSADFRRGKPNVDYSWDNKLDSKGDTSREDRLTTRITARIIDVKPNGQLVVEGRARLQHDDEISTITITGTARKEDVSADNTILSTQIADLEIAIENEGALRAAATRGWIPKLIDWLKPF